MKKTFALMTLLCAFQVLIFTESLALFFIPANSTSDLTERRQVLLTVENSDTVERKDEIVSGGIPLPRGWIYDPSHIQIFDKNGIALLTQAHQLGISWPDGSLRWALVQFPASIPASSSTEFYLAVDENPRQRNSGGVTVHEYAGKIIVDTGNLRFSLDKTGAETGRGSFLPAELFLREQDIHSLLNGHPEIQYRADREYMSVEQFLETGQHPNSLWSFGLKGIPGEYGDRVRHTYIQPDRMAPWKDWSNYITYDIDYSGFFSGPIQWQVEEKGPVRAVIYFERDAEERTGEIGYSGRLYAYVNQPVLRVELSIVNYEESPLVPLVKDGMNRPVGISNTKHVREFSLGFRPSFKPESVIFGTENGYVVSDGNHSSRLLQDRANRYAITENTSEPEEKARERAAGLHAPGWITVEKGQNRLSLGTKYFWEIFPKALSFDPQNQEIKLELWPGDIDSPGYPFTPGRMRTYEFVLGFGMDGPTTSAWSRSELRPYPDPEYMASTGATHRFLPVKNAHEFPAYRKFVNNSMKQFKEEQLLYGDLHFGDQYGWSRFSTASGYHGVAQELFMYYLASGNPEYFRLAEAAAWHNIDIDQIHWGDRAGEHVKQHTRQRDHLTINAHGAIGVWNFGDVHYYFLTGKRRILPALKNTSDFLMESGAFQPGSFWQRRATTLPAKHLAYMLEAFGDENSIAALYPESFTAGSYPHRNDADAERSSQIIKRLKQAAHHLTDLVENRKPGDEFQQSSFQASYPPEALYRFWLLTGDDRARKGALMYTDYLCHEYIHVTGIPKFRDMPSHHPSEMRWLPWYDEVDLPAARAYELSGDPAYLSCAWAPLDWRLHFFQRAHRHGGFNSTIPQTLWYMREAGMTERDFIRMRNDLDLDLAIKHLSIEVLPYREPRYYSAMRLEGARVLMNAGRFEEAEYWLHQVDFRSLSGEYDDSSLFWNRLHNLMRIESFRK